MKGWNVISTIVGMAVTSAESIIEKEGYEFDYVDEEDGLKIKFYSNESTFNHPKYSDGLDDMICIGSRNGKVVAVSFIYGDEENKTETAATADYQFRKAITAAGFGIINIDKSDLNTTNYYHHHINEQNIILDQFLQKDGKVILSIISIHNKDEDNGLISEPSKDFDLSHLSDFVKILNTRIKYARLNFQEPSYKFEVTGKTDSDKRSIQFVIKNNLLYARMNFPAGGSCPETLTDVRVEYKGSRGTSSDNTFYLAFDYKLQCSSASYDRIYVFFNWSTENFYESAAARMRQCASDGY